MKIKYALIVVGLLVLQSLISSNGIRYIFKINNEIKKVKKEIAEIKKENVEQKIKLQELKDNPKLLEIYARTKLGMVRPDDTIYEIK